MKRSTGLKKYYLALEVFLIMITTISFYPVFLVVADSFKTRDELAYNPFGLPSLAGFTLDNIVNAIYQMQFYKPLLNSVIITALSTTLIIIVSSLAAYPITRKKGVFYNSLYMFFLSGIMIPYQLAMVPLYKLVRTLGFINKEIGLVLVYGGVLLSFPIFFYSGFIKTVPLELEEAAVIDGCNRYKIFRSVVFPLLKPATATVIVLNVLSVWNEFTLSLLFLQKASKMTINVAMYIFRGQYHVNWPHMFAGILIAVFPVVILFLSIQKYFIKGITAGALKG